MIMKILVILGMKIFAWPYEAVLVSVAIGALESTRNGVEIGIDQLDRFF